MNRFSFYLPLLLLLPLEAVYAIDGLSLETQALERQLDYDINDQFDAIAEDLAELQSLGLDVHIDRELGIEMVAEGISESVVQDVADEFVADISLDVEPSEVEPPEIEPPELDGPEIEPEIEPPEIEPPEIEPPEIE
ncbi:MAG: hypothetical protein HRU20_27210, partial [Pseudomonadales bacterium]|nr:hypothetical protein [Pseudomonadales bacterium]